VRLAFVATGFVLALGVAAVSAQDAPDDQATTGTHSGLSGRVLLASRCPVPLGGDDTTCPALPLATALAVRSADGSTDVAQVATDADGQFSVSLEPGQYLVVVPAPDGIRVSAQTLVTVLPDVQTAITIQVRPSPRSLP
jgi:hypothetical protein